jgi:hypothetical protein
MLSEEQRFRLIKYHLQGADWFGAALKVFPEDGSASLRVSAWAKKNITEDEIEKVKKQDGVYIEPTKAEFVAHLWGKLNDPRYREQYPLIAQQLSKTKGWDAPTNANINVLIPRVVEVPTISSEAEWQKLAINDFKRLTTNARDAEEI